MKIVLAVLRIHSVWEMERFQKLDASIVLRLTLLSYPYAQRFGVLLLVIFGSPF